MARQIDLDQLMKYPLRRGSEHCDEKNADPRFLNGVESVLEWAQTLPTLTPPNEWVSVEDAVPDPGVRVLAANGSFVGEAYMASNGAWMRHDGFPWEVDAWMPMPDRRPPEGEANETK